jgi:hypothetical protein
MLEDCNPKGGHCRNSHGRKMVCGQCESNCRPIPLVEYDNLRATISVTLARPPSLVAHRHRSTPVTRACERAEECIVSIQCNFNPTRDCTVVAAIACARQLLLGAPYYSNPSPHFHTGFITSLVYKCSYFAQFLHQFHTFWTFFHLFITSSTSFSFVKCLWPYFTLVRS